MNGAQAIDALLSPAQTVDLILTDIMMPEVDGMELMKLVQARESPFRSIPIIIMSTVDTDEIKLKCGDAGASDYLVKPLRKEQMKTLGRHAAHACGSFNSGMSTGAGGTERGVQTTGSGWPAGNQKSGGSNNSADTAQGVRGVSPEEPSSAREESADFDEAVATLGRGKRATRVADRRAQQLRDDETREAADVEKAKDLKAKRVREKETKARVTAANRAIGVFPPTVAPGGEGKQGTTGEQLRRDTPTRGAGSGSGCGSGGSGSGAGEEQNVEGLSVQLVKAYGGATTMLELHLPSPSGETAPKVVLRRSASRSAFQSFLNLEDAVAARVISLKVDPLVTARAEGALASLAGIAAVAQEGVGAEDRYEQAQAARGINAARGMPNAPAGAMNPFFSMPGMQCGGGGMPLPHFMGMMPGQASAPGMQPSMGAPGMFPPCPPGVDPMLYAQHMGTAASAASSAAASAGPVGSAAAASEFVSKFYSVLQSTMELGAQHAAFARVGHAGAADGTCAARRAEAIARYLKKRKDRNFEKKVRYASRKRLAEARPRVRGQFVRLKEGETDEEGNDCGGGSGSGDETGAGSAGGSTGGGSKEASQSPERPDGIRSGCSE